MLGAHILEQYHGQYLRLTVLLILSQLHHLLCLPQAVEPYPVEIVAVICASVALGYFL